MNTMSLECHTSQSPERPIPRSCGQPGDRRGAAAASQDHDIPRNIDVQMKQVVDDPLGRTIVIAEHADGLRLGLAEGAQALQVGIPVIPERMHSKATILSPLDKSLEPDFSLRALDAHRRAFGRERTAPLLSR